VSSPHGPVLQEMGTPRIAGISHREKTLSSPCSGSGNGANASLSFISNRAVLLTSRKLVPRSVMAYLYRVEAYSANPPTWISKPDSFKKKLNLQFNREYQEHISKYITKYGCSVPGHISTTKDILFALWWSLKHVTILLLP